MGMSRDQIAAAEPLCSLRAPQFALRQVANEKGAAFPHNPSQAKDPALWDHRAFASRGRTRRAKGNPSPESLRLT
jgi:hypothetical protein